MGFPRQEYWSGLPFPSPGDLADPGIKPMSPELQTDSLPQSHQGSLCHHPFLSWHKFTTSPKKHNPSGKAPKFLLITSHIPQTYPKGYCPQLSDRLDGLSLHLGVHPSLSFWLLVLSPFFFPVSSTSLCTCLFPHLPHIKFTPSSESTPQTGVASIILSCPRVAMRLPKSVTQCFKFSNLTASHQIQTLIQVTANWLPANDEFTCDF